MAEINSSQSNKSKSSFSKSSNRRSTRVDLTPMVDLGFLLITFFVFTTSMTQPKAMNLIETKDGKPVIVKESGTLTIILGTNHKIFYYYGILNEDISPTIMETDFKTIRSVIVKMKKQSSLTDLMFIIKAQNKSTFGDSINILDEMTICDIKDGHHAEVDITDKESELINSKSSGN